MLGLLKSLYHLRNFVRNVKSRFDCVKFRRNMQLLDEQFNVTTYSDETAAVDKFGYAMHAWGRTRHREGQWTSN